LRKDSIPVRKSALNLLFCAVECVAWLTKTAISVMTSKQKPPQMGFDQRWIQHQRKINKQSQTWACANCINRQIFTNTDELWSHCVETHHEKIPAAESERRRYRTRFEAESLSKRTPESPRSVEILLYIQLQGCRWSLCYQPTPG
jgi:hypothetical protein